MGGQARNLARAKARARAVLLSCALAMLALLGWPLVTFLMSPEAPPPNGDRPQPEPR